jgi:AraC-like DNA-binding protein
VSIQQKLTTFDRELALYGRFESETVETTFRSAGQALLTRCGPFHAVDVRARNLASRRSAMGGHWRDNAILMLQHEGVAYARQYGRQIILRPGDVYIMDTMAPLELTVPDSSRATCVAVARAGVASLAPQSEAIFGTKISGDEGFARLIQPFLVALLGDSHSYRADEARTVADVLQSMLAHAVGRPADGMAGVDYDDRLHSIKAWAARNLDDPALDGARIARQFGLSRSALYRLFATAGETPQAWLVSERLERALQILSNPTRAMGSISATCYALGFNDPAHFSRLFRQRFGTCPRDVRSAARKSPPVDMTLGRGPESRST